MALLAAGSLTNVYGSLDLYLQAALVDAQGQPLALRLHGVRRFVPPVEDPWIEAHYDFLGLSAAFQRQIGGSILGTHRQGYLQLNLYQRARVFTTRYTTAGMRDLVVAAFPDGGIAPIYDLSVADANTPAPVVGAFILDGVQEHVLDTGQQSGIIQHVLQVATRYLEHFTRIS